MPQVSRRRLPKEVLKSLSDSLIFVFKDLTGKEEMEAFLNSLLTETEKLMLAKRIAMAYLLKEKAEEKRIADLLAVTPATVSRMKLWVQIHSRGFEILFGKLEKEKRLKETNEILISLLRYAIRAAGGHP